MASIQKHKSGWRCQVRKEGYPTQSKKFDTKAEATAWGNEVEAKMGRGTYVPEVNGQTMTVGQMLDKYVTEVAIHKASHKADKSRAKPLKKALRAYRVHTLTKDILRDYKTDRLKSVGPQTVVHELTLLQRAYSVAVAEWDVTLPNGIPKTTRPKLPKGRDKRVPQSHLEAILKNTESTELAVIAELAVETLMRRSELVMIRAENVNLSRRTAYLPETKTDSPRTVPLSRRAVQLFESMSMPDEGRVFTLMPDSVSHGFKRACKRAKMSELTFHDLRHEAISRLFEKGFNVIEVAKISGHKTTAMLMRYTHLDASMLAHRMD